MKKVLLFIVFLSISIISFGQKISGKIIDKYGIEISEVNIYNLSSGTHTHSDEIGFYELKTTNIGDTLQFSHIAFNSKFIIVEKLGQQDQIELEDLSILLDEIVISNQVNVLDLISKIDVQINPVTSSQDILRKVPGLFIGQHAGGGKAEQIFLRGFDIDHGTDINITVDNTPVNMTSHAHGQGYSDLHFIIPETIDNIDFEKGTYDASKGNFATAGYVNFKTKNKLDNSIIKTEIGAYNTKRLLGMFNVLDKEKHSAYIASEYKTSDGYFESSQNFQRINLFGKYKGFISNRDIIGLTASHFSSSWDASGQIPTRAVEQNLITRFGAVDDTEGGQTSRTNLSFTYDKIIDKTASIKNSIYYSNYDFELYSNFTFYLDDTINGDQIKQKENRNIYGLKSEYNKLYDFKNITGKLIAGVDFRNDIVDDIELSHTLNRTETLEQIQFGAINETNIGAYIGTTLNYNKWTINPAIRIDNFNFAYTNYISTSYDKQSATKTILSPKLNITYNQSDNLQLYIKAGKGFHSNDARVVVAQDGIDILPAAYGYDLGYFWKPTPKMFINMAYWFLFMEQEFVYVGDAGIVEPSGKTQRQGIDLSYRYQPTKSLFWNFDINYTHARSIEEEIGENYIPLVPDLTLLSGINYQHKSGVFGSANVRFMSDRPANEDYSIIAEGYTVIDLNIGYTWKRLEFGVQIQNLFNTEWNETQFATESRLIFETESVEEIHYTSGTPRYIQASLQYNF